MSLNDKRLLAELGAVLAIKIVALFLIKVCFFSPEPGKGPLPLTSGGFSSEKPRAGEAGYGADKE